MYACIYILMCAYIYIDVCIYIYMALYTTILSWIGTSCAHDAAVAVCYSVLQCVAVCCNVLQCVVQCVATCCSDAPNQRSCLEIRADRDLARHACRDLARCVHTTRLYASFQRLALHRLEETNQKRPTYIRRDQQNTPRYTRRVFSKTRPTYTKRDLQKRPTKTALQISKEIRRGLCKTRVFKGSRPMQKRPTKEPCIHQKRPTKRP